MIFLTELRRARRMRHTVRCTRLHMVSNPGNYRARNGGKQFEETDRFYVAE